MDLLIALWLVVSLPAALLGGRWIRSSDRGGVEEIEAYLRHLSGPRRVGWRTVVGTGLATISVLGSLLVASTVLPHGLPPLDVITRPAAFAFGPFRPASPTTAPAAAPPAPPPRAVSDPAPRPVHPPRPTIDDGLVDVMPAATPEETPGERSNETPDDTAVTEPPADRQASDPDGLAWMADPTASAPEGGGAATGTDDSDTDRQGDNGTAAPPAADQPRPRAAPAPSTAPATTQPTTTTTTTTTTESPAPPG